MGTKRSEVQVLASKKESSYGSDASPGVTDAMPIMEPVFPEFDPAVIERGHPIGNMSRIKPLIGGRKTKVNFKAEYYGSGAVDTAPRIGSQIQACGFDETVNSSTSVVYTVSSSSIVSTTDYLYIDGLLYKILGSVGNMKISGKTGEPVMFEFEKTGLYQDDADSAIVTPNFGSNFQSPPQAFSATLTLDSVTTFILREFNIDCGISIIERPSFGGAHGFAGFLTGKMGMTGNIILEGESKATYDFLAKFEAATQVACSIPIGSDTGNQIQIDMNLTYTNLQVEDADGLVTFNIPIALSFLSNSSKELTITCT